MYQAHWNLETTPFHAGCETEFYYPSETHQAALLKLRYAIENRQGAAMMVAESGLGKTVKNKLNSSLRIEFPRGHGVRISSRCLPTSESRSAGPQFYSQTYSNQLR